MRVPIYWVGFESELWDLPPGHEKVHAIFLDKAQAIAFVKNEWQELERIPEYDEYTIFKQVETPDGITMRKMYTYRGGQIIKHKREE